MGNTLNPQAWSSTPADNDGIDAGIGTISDQMQTASVDNVDRGVMASVRNLSKDIGGAIVAGGTANAITLTTNQSLSAAHLAAGLSLRFRATGTNTGPMTANIDTIGATALVDQFGGALPAGAVTLGGIYDLAFNAATNNLRLLNPAVLPTASVTGAGSAGIVFLASGTVVGVATLDISIGGYGIAYPGLKFVLSRFVPTTDGVNLGMRFSVNGGVSYATTGYRYNNHGIVDSTDTPVVNRSASTTGIPIAGLSGSISAPAGYPIGSDASEGYNGEVTLLFSSNSFTRKRLHHQGYFFSNAVATEGIHIVGGGAFDTVSSSVDAVRFYFSSGNIAVGRYAVYGLRF